MEKGNHHRIGNIIPRFEACVIGISVLLLLLGLCGLEVHSRHGKLEAREDVWRISLHDDVDLSGMMSAQVEQKTKLILTLAITTPGSLMSAMLKVLVCMRKKDEGWYNGCYELRFIVVVGLRKVC